MMKNLGLTKKIITVLTLTITLVSLFFWYISLKPKHGGDFQLTYYGTPWTFSHDAKKFNLLYFGYSKCPDICPLTLSYAGQTFKKLSADQLLHVRFIFVSVDADNDHPTDVAEYAKNFDLSFVGLSGTRNEIDKTIAMFPASYIIEKDPKSYLGYSISHTDRIFILNKKGELIDSVSGSKDSQELYLKLKEYL